MSNSSRFFDQKSNFSHQMFSNIFLKINTPETTIKFPCLRLVLSLRINRFLLDVTNSCAYAPQSFTDTTTLLYTFYGPMHQFIPSSNELLGDSYVE